MGSNLNFKNFGNDGFYSLTFDELQSTVGESGKDFGSMNMDELLRSIWSAEEIQNVGSTSAGGAATTSGNLHRQGSLILPRTLSQKTVDEVLRDISKDIDGAPHRQPTLGELTLEEFLVKAGVVREDTQSAPIINNYTCNNNNDNNVGSFGDLWHPVNRLPVNVSGARSSVQQLENQQQQQQQQLQILPKQTTSGYGMSNTMALQGVGANGVASPLVSPVPYVFNGGGLRGRRSAAVEKVVERRQKRMIKNRESAARSRARKQAYTTELEEEVAKLKEEQEELQKKQAEMLEMQKNQFLEMMKQQDGGKRQCLRRTQTGSW